ncbi:hypothetical protein M413DRAFT_26992 [Hebeloma cylindrosporum]|uniref:Uncharacterized protein n=1 Tax=Hebeloma cylindrosporum TaxID=76867 RepID=A0A0C3C004_HEBCY|nr:hypothetical protein M413DRAFT_26992 [Hebeloma cylindrosporum h7]
MNQSGLATTTEEDTVVAIIRAMQALGLNVCLAADFQGDVPSLVARLDAAMQHQLARHLEISSQQDSAVASIAERRTEDSEDADITTDEESQAIAVAQALDYLAEEATQAADLEARFLENEELEELERAPDRWAHLDWSLDDMSYDPYNSDDDQCGCYSSYGKDDDGEVVHYDCEYS